MCVVSCLVQTTYFHNNSRSWHLPPTLACTNGFGSFVGWLDLINESVYPSINRLNFWIHGNFHHSRQTVYLALCFLIFVSQVNVMQSHIFSRRKTDELDRYLYICILSTTTQHTPVFDIAYILTYKPSNQNQWSKFPGHREWLPQGSQRRWAGPSCLPRTAPTSEAAPSLACQYCQEHRCRVCCGKWASAWHQFEGHFFV